MALRVFRIANFLSVDVALGACAGMYFFAKLLRVKLDPSVYLLMALSVWVIYTFDHLLDAYFIENERASPRHRFHRDHFNVLRIALVIASCCAILGGYLLLSGTKLFLVAIGLATMIGVSLLMTQFFKTTFARWKEASIALFYVLGIMLVPLFNKEYLQLDYTWVAFGIGYFLLAWYNLVFLSVLDYKSDSLSGQHSFVTAVGHGRSIRMLQWAGIIGLVYFIALLFFLPSFYHVFTAILIVVFSWHVRFLLKYRKFPKETLRRRLEFSFLMPFALVVLPL
ncbi:hypothetical protein [Lunatimonas lonarensis]|nr:hypothetical protein [Lunatimonas lonarensis]